MRLDIRADPQQSKYYRVVEADSGKIVSGWLAADDEDGWYETYKYDSTGQIAKDADGDQIVLIIQAKIRFTYLGAVP